MTQLLWYTVEYIENDILAIGENAHWEHTRSYLFRGKDVSWLVDTGTGIGNIHSLVRSLTSSPINVITTHVHWDHIGGHAQFETVYVHEQEASWLRDGIPIPLSVLKAQIAKVPFTPPQDSQFVLESYVPPRVKTPHIVHHGDCVSNSNFLLESLHTREQLHHGIGEHVGNAIGFLF